MGNKSKGGVSIVVGVITPNGTSVSGYGNISKANTTKVNGDTIFDIGSITKTFTTTLLADMVKRGLVKLDDPLQKYLPSNVKVPTYHNDGHNITLEDLATHTSGLPDLPAKLFDNHSLPTAQIYNYVSHAQLVSEPGARYSYNNLGLGLLGYVLSLKAWVPYGQLVKDRILNALGMDSTVPAGAFYSSANDLLKYLAANMGLIHTKINDILQDTHLIRHEVLTIANSSITKRLLASYVGLGWQILTNFGTEVIWHNGAIDGYISFIEFNPTKQIGAVVLCSCDEKDVPGNWVDVVYKSLLHSTGIIT
jgi:CubicO group peptidase (beta-lactamase class C family)